MKSDDKVLRENSAFAAALAGIKEACPVLCKMALQNPNNENKHYAYDCTTARAIYLLGRLKDKSAVKILKSIIEFDNDSDKYKPIRLLAENALKVINS